MQEERTEARPPAPATPRDAKGVPVGLRAQARRAVRLARLVVYMGVGFVIATTAWAHRRATGSTRWGALLSRWWFHRLLRVLGIRLRVRGTVPERGVFLAANHISWLDIPAIGSLLPAHFVSKAEIRNWPLMGWLAYGGGTVFIPRGAGRTREISRQVSERLAAGASVLVFPEGTTSEGSGVRPFFPRLFASAQETACVVQPVAVRYLPPPGWSGAGAERGVHPTAPFIDEDPFGAHLLRVAKEPFLDVEVTFCEPFAAGEEADRKALAGRAWEEVAGTLGLEAAPRPTLRPRPDRGIEAPTP